MMYYMKEIREILMTMEIQFNRLANYADHDDLRMFVGEVKSLLKKIEKPTDGEVPLINLKAACEKIKIKV